jgi:hypothetical protein
MVGLLRAKEGPGWPTDPSGVPLRVGVCHMPPATSGWTLDCRPGMREHSLDGMLRPCGVCIGPCRPGYTGADPGIDVGACTFRAVSATAHVPVRTVRGSS